MESQVCMDTSNTDLVVCAPVWQFDEAQRQYSNDHRIGAFVAMQMSPLFIRKHGSSAGEPARALITTAQPSYGTKPTIHFLSHPHRSSLHTSNVSLTEYCIAIQSSKTSDKTSGSFFPVESSCTGDRISLHTGPYLGYIAHFSSKY